MSSILNRLMSPKFSSAWIVIWVEAGLGYILSVGGDDCIFGLGVSMAQLEETSKF